MLVLFFTDTIASSASNNATGASIVVLILVQAAPKLAVPVLVPVVPVKAVEHRY